MEYCQPEPAALAISFVMTVVVAWLFFDKEGNA